MLSQVPSEFRAKISSKNNGLPWANGLLGTNGQTQVLKPPKQTNSIFVFSSYVWLFRRENESIPFFPTHWTVGFYTDSLLDRSTVGLDWRFIYCFPLTGKVKQNKECKGFFKAFKISNVLPGEGET